LTIRCSAERGRAESRLHATAPDIAPLRDFPTASDTAAAKIRAFAAARNVPRDFPVAGHPEDIQAARRPLFERLPILQFQPLTGVVKK
jgi:hypothetical protein